VHDSSASGSKVVIGSGTFDHVQAQLNNQPSEQASVAAPVTTATQKPDSLTSKPRLTFSGCDVCVILSVLQNYHCCQVLIISDREDMVDTLLLSRDIY